MSSEAIVEIFSRTEELEALRKRLASRKSTLLYGQSGVGKTLLLMQAMPEFMRILYCPASSSPQSVFRLSEGRFYAACVGQFKRRRFTLIGDLIGE